MMTQQWDYEGYWNAVLGAHRSAADVIADFDLSDAGLDEWLGLAESDAIVESRGTLNRQDTLSAWTAFHAKALVELTEAAQS